MSEVQGEKQQRKSKHKVLLLKNIKYNGHRYKIGDEIDVEVKDLDSFVKSGIIKR